MKKLIFFLLGAMSLYAHGQTTMDSYLTHAAEHNPGLKAKFNDYLAAMEQIPQSTALPDPQITFGLFILPVETRVGPQRATLAVNQAFPWFGTLRAQGDAATKMAEARLFAFENAKLKLYRDVKIKYNELYFLKQSILLTQENLKLLSSFKELARVNFESGKTGFVSILRVEMEEKELTARLASLQDAIATATTEFENLLNVPLKDPISFPDRLALAEIDQNRQSLYDSIMAFNSELQELQTLLEGKELQLRVATLMGKPTLTVGAGYINVAERSGIDIPENGRDALLLPQLGMRLPIAQKKYKAMQKQVAIEKEGFQFRIEDQKNQLSSELERLLQAQKDAQRRLDLYHNLYDLAERSLSLLQTEFTTGEADFEELLRMERKFLTYQLAIQKASVDNNNAVFSINYLIGK